ncbi:hypothetical protein QR680_009860 [Steinernema hermaphroditum]|uniref:Uncharacterized protein n=1 Tax=Steinernema hermaphroditum TaxID=289476 RepID=A0AA39IPA8_9BILA|nr:hypothetical protein QR680_009860 [Steinernema hermaphroditum]
MSGSQKRRCSQLNPSVCSAFTSTSGGVESVGWNASWSFVSTLRNHPRPHQAEQFCGLQPVKMAQVQLKDERNVSKIDNDITAKPETKDDKVAVPEGAKVDKLETEGQYAVSNPGTESTYQRVEQGTRTALIYWDGWLTARDAMEFEKEGDYFVSAPEKDKERTTKKIVRMVSLDTAPNGKNWSYGPNGEVIYHKTGFVGIFDKTVSRNQMNEIVSQYGSLIPVSNALLPVQTGPSIGTQYDLTKGQKSAYASVSSHGASGKGGGIAGAQNPMLPGSGNAKQNVSAYNEVGRDQRSAYASFSSHGAVAKGGEKAGTQNPMLPGSGNAKQNVSAYNEVGRDQRSAYASFSSHGVVAKGGGKAGAQNPMLPGSGNTRQNTSAYNDVVGDQRGQGVSDSRSGYPNDGYSGPWGANGPPYRKNWKIENGKIVYISTGFVSAAKSGALRGNISGVGNFQQRQDSSAYMSAGGSGAVGGSSAGIGRTRSGYQDGNFQQRQDSSAYMSAGGSGAVGGNSAGIGRTRSGYQDGNFQQRQDGSAYMSAGGSGAVGGGSAGIGRTRSGYQDGNFQQRQDVSAYMSAGGSGAVGGGSAGLGRTQSGNQDGNFQQRQESSAYMSAGGSGAVGGSSAGIGRTRSGYQDGNFQQRQDASAYMSAGGSGAVSGGSAGFGRTQGGNKDGNFQQRHGSSAYMDANVSGVNGGNYGLGGLGPKGSQASNFQQRHNSSAYLDAASVITGGGCKGITRTGGIGASGKKSNLDARDLGKEGYGNKTFDGYPNDGYNGPWSANGAPYRKNWKIEGGKIAYIPTGFVGYFDPKKTHSGGHSVAAGSTSGGSQTPRSAYL